MKMMMLWASVDPRLSTEPVTERNEIPGAAKLGKIYHFVWSREGTSPQHSSGYKRERDGGGGRLRSDLSRDIKLLKT